ncbi:hypothetical protein BH11ARM2_BH11ARM2_08520 [soil metagenome]
MWNVLEPWQTRQLQRLAAIDPERAEGMLNTLWQQYPGLYEELTIMALDQNAITLAQATELLAVPSAEIDAKLVAWRRRDVGSERLVVPGLIAKLDEGGVPVWEVVREFRKLGSVERLESRFPTLNRGQIAAALRYAQTHPQEIEDQISRYEEARERQRAEYPFAGR